MQGSDDEQIPSQIPSQLPLRWAERAKRLGEAVAVYIIPGAGHFDIVDPESKAWPRVRAAFLKATT